MHLLLSFAAAIVPIFLLLVGSELWWRGHDLHSELSRKFVHVTVGSFVAFWPYFLSWDQIRLLSIAFLIVVSVSKYLQFFQAIHNVQRPTYGELFFAVAVGASTYITQDAGVYAVAILFMSLADGFAAVIGTEFGIRNQYKVFGHAKSLAGSGTFFVTALLIVILYNMIGGHDANYGLLVLLTVAATAIENVGIFGLDNLLVPLLTALALAFI